MVYIYIYIINLELFELDCLREFYFLIVNLTSYRKLTSFYRSIIKRVISYANYKHYYILTSDIRLIARWEKENEKKRLG